MAACIPAGAQEYSLSNGRIGVTIGEDGSLVSLSNETSGQEYAYGAYMWRLY